jgi:hypothetical protein
MRSFLVLLLFWGCTNDPDLMPVAGGASDTETAMVQGFVRFEPNTYGIEIVLHLFSMDFIPDAPVQDILSAKAIDTLGGSGGFSIDSLGPGSYRILAVETSTQYNAFIGPFTVRPSSAPVPLDTVTLDAPGDIAGYAVSPDTMICLDVKAFIKGSPFWTVSDSAGYFSIKGVPAGPVLLSYKRLLKKCFRDTAKVLVDTMTYDYDPLIQVTPQDTVVVPNILN